MNYGNIRLPVRSIGDPPDCRMIEGLSDSEERLLTILSVVHDSCGSMAAALLYALREYARRMSASDNVPGGIFPVHCRRVQSRAVHLEFSPQKPSVTQQENAVRARGISGNNRVLYILLRDCGIYVVRCGREGISGVLRTVVYGAYALDTGICSGAGICIRKTDLRPELHQ